MDSGEVRKHAISAVLGNFRACEKKLPPVTMGIATKNEKHIIVDTKGKYKVVLSSKQLE